MKQLHRQGEHKTTRFTTDSCGLCTYSTKSSLIIFTLGYTSLPLSFITRRGMTKFDEVESVNTQRYIFHLYRLLQSPLFVERILLSLCRALWCILRLTWRIWQSNLAH